jgi:esterase/lipase superfamily enzyme
MILASCRKNFTSTLSLAPLQMRDSSGAPFDLASAPSRFNKGQKVCILVHGFHTKYEGAVGAYAEVEANSKAAGMDYTFIGFLWPGSPIAAGFFPAISRATEAGEALFLLIWKLKLFGCEITIETHSLGARVCLEALKISKSTLMGVELVVLTAPAVDAGVFLASGEFAGISAYTKRIAVMYSDNDPVLRYAYFGAELILEHRMVHALGLDGPLMPEPDNCASYDLSALIRNHGAYAGCPEVYKLWREIYCAPPQRKGSSQARDR